MYTLIAENKYKQQIELTHNRNYSISEITGFDPAEANINSSHNAGADGAVYNSSYIKEREITITLNINYPAEQNRVDLYKYFKTKFPVRLYYKTSLRDVYIDGYVTNIDVSYFDQKQIVQIAVKCTLPHLIGINKTEKEFANVVALFEFPFTIEAAGIPFSELLPYSETNIVNYGDIDAGTIIRIHATGSVLNPTIYNVKTNEFLKINIEMEAGDEIFINTTRGEKEITLLRSGVESGIVGLLEEGSTWFQLSPGDNVFTLSTSDHDLSNCFVTFEFNQLYQGV